MALWFEVKKCCKTYGLNLPAMLELIVRQWLVGKGREEDLISKT